MNKKTTGTEVADMLDEINSTLCSLWNKARVVADGEGFNDAEYDRLITGLKETDAVVKKLWNLAAECSENDKEK
jgi:hypothetical protein